ncbi:MAG: VOC family protein [Ginsengibacter sp.]
MLNRIHHTAIICSDYEKSKSFYTNILGLEIIREIYRKDRQSYKVDLSLHGEYVIELFSFPEPPLRLSRPEAAGLRHLAFEVNNLCDTIEILESNNIICEPIRLDEVNNRQFTFFSDPDNLPIELYEK